MANVTILPDFYFGQWARPNSPNPTLSGGLTGGASASTSLSFTYALLDKDGNAPTQPIIIGIKKINGYVESVLIPSGTLDYDAQTGDFTVGDILTGGTSGAKAVIVRDSDDGTTGTLTLVVLSGTFQNDETITDESGGSATANGTLTACLASNGLSATNCVRGIELDGLDYVTGDSTLAVEHDADEEVFVNITGVYESILKATFNGNISTNGTGLSIGTGADGTITVFRNTDGTQKGFVRWNTSNDKAQYSNDGTTWVNFEDVSASNLVANSATDTNPDYLANKMAAGDGIDLQTLNGGGDEEREIAVDVTDIIDTAAGLTESSNNIQVNLATDPGLQFTGGALDTKLKTAGGLDKDSDGLFVTDSVNSTESYVVAEDVTADDAVALLPYEVEWYTQLTEADIDLGDANARRRYAIEITPKSTVTITDFNFRIKKFSSGQDITVRVETDNSGEPSGALIDANATATIAASGVSTSYGTHVATFAGTFSLTAGTTYWIVFSVASTDGTNYMALGVNSSYDENYITFERQTFDQDTLTWGNAVTNATPFFWGNTETVPLGFGVVPTDANWGARTWNFIGFAATSVSADSSVDVYYDTVPDLSGLNLRKVYYLSTTAGAITASAPTSSIYLSGTQPSAFVYKIGKPLSTTRLKIETGEKKVVIHEDTAITATTTRNYIIWFEMDWATVHGYGDDNTNLGGSSGYISPGAGDGSVRFAGQGSTTSSTSQSLGLSTGGSSLLGAASNLTEIGFDYTYTESGTMTDAYIIIEAKQQ